MDFINKFKEAFSNQAIRLNTLEIDRKYEIVRVEKITTKYRPSALPSVRETDYNIVKVFLPKRYSNVFTDDDIRL
jgi:hypothetical protein